MGAHDSPPPARRHERHSGVGLRSAPRLRPLSVLSDTRRASCRRVRTSDASYRLGRRVTHPETSIIPRSAPDSRKHETISGIGSDDRLEAIAAIRLDSGAETTHLMGTLRICGAAPGDDRGGRYRGGRFGLANLARGASAAVAAFTSRLTRRENAEGSRGMSIARL